jgi:hypothetical protein
LYLNTRANASSKFAAENGGFFPAMPSATPYPNHTTVTSMVDINQLKIGLAISYLGPM